MKSCSFCHELKHNGDFRKSSKTVDGLYPFCKQCAVIGRIKTRSSFETVCKIVWNDLEDLAFNAPAGTVLYTNKRIFMEFLRYSSIFWSLYKTWKEYEYGTMRLTVRLRHDKGNFEFDNLFFYIRELEEGETLKLSSHKPAVRK